jgi:hypothetical protein
LPARLLTLRMMAKRMTWKTRGTIHLKIMSRREMGVGFKVETKRPLTKCVVFMKE